MLCANCAWGYGSLGVVSGSTKSTVDDGVDIKFCKFCSEIGFRNERGKKYSECKVKVSEWLRQVTMNLMLRVIAGKRYSFGDSERHKEARQFARTMDEFMYLAGVSECSDVIPGIEWLDLQGNVKAMKRNGGGGGGRRWWKMVAGGG
ncbi:hypothetical protein TEA_027774 [Camellia sinensis var. sinensis]|uniref:Uncharacterized protein n=1 Tax=Camellia sinensis var. sinensis TaxID=542762 RepID=A0A4S4CY45_CAMSN|nr:hypothetical protein TEA_027774 [Camellia sinensis var. sinensis]